MQYVKVQLNYPGDRILTINSKERAIYFVVSGSFFGLDDTYPSTRDLYRPGAVIGVDQFLQSDRWDMDLLCKEEGLIGKFDYSAFELLKQDNPQTAMKLMNRIIRHKCYQLIYDKKNKIDYFTDRMEKEYEGLNLEDKDLLVDLRLGSEKAIYNLFRANMSNLMDKRVDAREIARQEEDEKLKNSGKGNFLTMK